MREGSLEAPTRHPLDWKNDEFWNEAALERELERVYDICHGCRRCVSLCQAFPTLFDLVDKSPTLEVDGIAKSDYGQVVEQCYLCDLCYQTKCPYVPPHQWNVDFPHLMLRAKAINHRRGDTKASARLISNTRLVGKFASIPVVVEAVNWGNRNPLLRKLLEKSLDVHRDAQLPTYHAPTARARLKRGQDDGDSAIAAGPTSGKVAIFITCYGDHNHPRMVEDLAAVLRHNGVAVKLLAREACCGMPKLELGDLDTVEKFKNANLPLLAEAVADGWDLIAPIPSCVLMFKQEIPLLFPEDALALKVKKAMYDPFEYLMLRHKAGALKTDFRNGLGKVSYHVPCHQRVQNIGLKTRDVLQLVPGTTIDVIERCSGHDGTYAVKSEYHRISMKIAGPVVSRVEQSGCDHYVSDCPMAGHQIENGLREKRQPESPFALLRHAYGI